MAAYLAACSGSNCCRGKAVEDAEATARPTEDEEEETIPFPILTSLASHTALAPSPAAGGAGLPDPVVERHTVTILRTELQLKEPLGVALKSCPVHLFSFPPS